VVAVVEFFMKKILGILLLSFMLNGNVLSEEIILECKLSKSTIKYKYVNDGTNVLTYSTHTKRDKGKWFRWPVTGVTEDNKHWLKSTKEAEAIIDGYKVTSKSKMIKLKNGNTAKNSYLTIDFENFTRKGKGTWKGKPYKVDMKCEKVES
jgi:hypothetical protein